MSENARRRSATEWFLESFFQERNIKWMLAVGVMIVFGSSLMLVTKEWDQWGPLWKALTIVGYSAAAFGCGELAFHRLGLRNTGTVMRCLTLLLFPLSFLAMQRWGLYAVANPSVDWWLRAEQGTLLLFDAMLTTLAGRRIFSQFLRGPQPTLVASYVTLAVTGGVLSPLPAGVAPLAALMLWAIFSAGTVKTARHVFWLAEEHRLPRVCGFLPIIVLGTQFLTLFLLTCAGEIALPWLGLGCVLTAVPVLLTTDAIAKVFQQRTGDLVRPLPRSIVLPLFVGLVFCLSGVCLSAIGFPFSLALAPSAGLTAVMMLVAARRTGQRAFVWAGLIGAALAYQSLPAYFSETARLVVSSAATVVREPRLPVAFYGLTWLPLILATTFASVRAVRRGDLLIGTPARQFSVIVVTLLFAMSFSHAKATFPVSAVMTLMFGLLAVVFRERRLLVGSAAAWIAVCLSVRLFLELVCGLPITAAIHQLLMTAGAGILLTVGHRIDQSGWAFPSQAPARPIFGGASVLLTLGVAAHWLCSGTALSVVSITTITGLALAVLLMAQAWKWPNCGLGEVAWSILFASIVKATLSFTRSNQVEVMLLVWTIAPLVVWIAARLCERSVLRASVLKKLTDALGRPALRISAVALLLTVMLAQTAFLATRLFGHSPVSLVPMWLPALLLIVWPFDAARWFQQRWLSVFGCLGLFSFVAITLLAPGTTQFIPVAWSLLASAGVLLISRVRRGTFDNDSSDMIRTPIRCVSMSVLVLTAAVTLLSFDLTMRLAGMIAVVALAVDATQRGDHDRRWLTFTVGHWQVTALVAKCLAPELIGLGDMLSSAMLNAALPIAFTLAAGLSFIRLRPRDSLAHELLGLHTFAGFAAIASMLLASLFVPFAAMTSGQAAAALTTFALLATTEFVLAVRRQQADGVWMAQGLVGAAVTWLLLAEVVTFGDGLAMFACLGAALVWLAASRMCARSSRSRFAAEALSVPANLLPLATVVIGVVRHIVNVESPWLGVNSLALLVSSAFYFWQGMEARVADQRSIRRDRFVVSAVILNVALTLLWRELAWSDPQFFMIPAGLSILGLVELLRREIPDSFRDPLRYAGALTILVSPTFHIVSGSWLHLISLMVCSLLVVLLAIGLRLRALVYSGTAFLIADLLAMVVRGSIDHPNLLWLAGLVIGAAVITLGAICENHRESLLTRLRLMAAELQTWD